MELVGVVLKPLAEGSALLTKSPLPSTSGAVRQPVSYDSWVVALCRHVSSMRRLENHLDCELALGTPEPFLSLESHEVIPSGFQNEGQTLSWISEKSQFSKNSYPSTIRCPQQAQIEVVQLAGLNQAHIKISKKNERVHPTWKASANLWDETRSGFPFKIRQLAIALTPVLVHVAEEARLDAVPVSAELPEKAKPGPIATNLSDAKPVASLRKACVKCRVERPNQPSQHRLKPFEANKVTWLLRPNQPPRVSSRLWPPQWDWQDKGIGFVQPFVVYAVVSENFQWDPVAMVAWSPRAIPFTGLPPIPVYLFLFYLQTTLIKQIFQKTVRVKHRNLLVSPSFGRFAVARHRAVHVSEVLSGVKRSNDWPKKQDKLSLKFPIYAKHWRDRLRQLCWHIFLVFHRFWVSMVFNVFSTQLQRLLHRFEKVPAIVPFGIAAKLHSDWRQVATRFLQTTVFETQNHILFEVWFPLARIPHWNWKNCHGRNWGLASCTRSPHLLGDAWGLKWALSGYCITEPLSQNTGEQGSISKFGKDVDKKVCPSIRSFITWQLDGRCRRANVIRLHVEVISCNFVLLLIHFIKTKPSSRIKNMAWVINNW